MKISAGLGGSTLDARGGIIGGSIELQQLDSEGITLKHHSFVIIVICVIISSEHISSCGLPQGSVLGLLLLLMNMYTTPGIMSFVHAIGLTNKL